MKTKLLGASGLVLAACALLSPGCQRTNRKLIGVVPKATSHLFFVSIHTGVDNNVGVVPQTAPMQLLSRAFRLSTPLPALLSSLAVAFEDLHRNDDSLLTASAEGITHDVPGGVRVMDIIATNTPPEFVLQLDVGTCLEAGVDPIVWMKANPGRIRSLHLKDWAPGSAAEQKAFRVLFGEGIGPWKEIFATAESVGGVEFYLMEQEGSRFSEFETAKRGLDTWRAMRKG